MGLKFLALALLFVASLGFVAPDQGGALPPARLGTVHESVVQIGEHCSGFVAQDGWVVTAAHCLRGGVAEVSVKFHDHVRSTFKVVVNHPPWCWASHCDVALLRGDTSHGVVAKLQPRNPGFEEQGYIVGHPHAVDVQMHGPVSFVAIRVGDLHVAGHIYPGDSGAPLFNGAGEVVGVVHSAMHPQNIPYGWAADIDLVIELLAAQSNQAF